MNIKQAVILCGGKGTRLMPFTKYNPKPLFPILGVPFLEHLIRLLKHRGIKNFLLLTGYKSKLIKQHFKKNKISNVNISYHSGLASWETNKRIFKSKSFLDKNFFLLYSDNFINFFPKKITEFHNLNKNPITITIFKKNNGNIYFDKKNENYSYVLERNKINSFVDLGFMCINKKYLFSVLPKTNTNFSETLYKASKNKKISYFETSDQYYSISDLERAKLTNEYFNRKKIILLDRDGIINIKAPRGSYITSWKKFILIKKNINTLRKLSFEGYKFIIITNQAGIARKKLTMNKLNLIHKKMTMELAKYNINILHIYSCNHGWYDECYCRKPKPGMFYSASKKFKFRLDKVIYIGDDIRDVEASYNAGCNSILIDNKFASNDTNNRIKQNKTFKNMSDAYNYINKFYISNDYY